MFLRRFEDIKVQVNFAAILKRGDEWLDRRDVHNVFTDIGRDWLAHLIAWNSLGDPDVPVTQRRVRWIGVGIGTTQLETAAVTAIEVPTPVDDAGNYLAALDSTEFPPSSVPTARFIREFGAEEITLVTNPTVPLSEAALFVDVHRVADIGGADDAPFSLGETTTLDPLVSNNGPVAYARFDPITKTRDFSIEFRWDFRFGQ